MNPVQNSQEIKCSGCGDMISPSIAKFAEDNEFEMGPESFRYYCPVCAIQAKNAAMQAQMIKVLKPS